MTFMTGHALRTWQRVKELHARIQTTTLRPEELARLHVEFRRATAGFRRAYAEEHARQRAAATAPTPYRTSPRGAPAPYLSA